MIRFAALLVSASFLGSTAFAGDAANCPSHILKASTVFGHSWLININKDSFDLTTSNGTKVNGVLVQFTCGSEGTFGFHATRTDGVQHGCNGKFSGNEITSSICTGGENIASGSFQ